MSYKLLLTITDENSIYNSQEFLFDLVSSRRINKRVDISTHPLVNGDLIGDHMYKQALSFSVDGMFGINSKEGLSIFPGEKDRLTNIQNFFEKLMDSGTVLNLKTFKKEDSSVTRFLERDNMVLESIQWTENQNVLDYSFSFKQILFSDVQAPVPTILQYNTLLALTEPRASSFFEEIFDEEALRKLIIQILYNSGIASERFWLNMAGNISDGILKETGFVIGAIGSGVATGAAIVLGIATTLPFVGWLVLGLTLLTAGCIHFAIKSHEENAKMVEGSKVFFDYYDNPEKRKEEYEKFEKLIKDLSNTIKELGKYIKAYDITSDQNQEILTYLDNDYYVFRFIRNNTTAKGINKSFVQTSKLDDAIYTDILDKNSKGNYTLEILTVGGDNLLTSGKKNVIGSSFEEAKNNPLFITEGNHYIYLINKKIDEIKRDYSDSDNTSLQTQIDEAQTDLRNFAIIDSAFDLNEFEDRISSILNNAILKYEG